MNILHIEDNPGDAELVSLLLLAEWPDCRINVVTTRNDLESHLENMKYDLVLSDFALGQFTGLDALRIVREKDLDLPFIFLSGTIGEDMAIEAVRAGAQDYVIKDRMKRLVTAIKRALKDTSAHRQREKAERRIREQAELLDKAHDAIIVTDLDNRITFWNRGAERISGWPAADAMGHSPEEMLGVGFHANIDEARTALASTGEWRGELNLHHRGGKPLVAEVSMTLIRDDRGRPMARLSIGTDVTEKKLMEEQFLRSQRVECVGMLASGIAHDLNNVLAPLLMGAPLLRARATNPTDLRILDTMESSAIRGAALVRQILSFAQGSGGENALIQLKHVLLDLTEMMRETFPKSIEVLDETPSDLWTIRGNATHLHQVLLNLCVNARDAMPHGGTLWIRAENRRLDEAAARLIRDSHPGSFVVVEVADSGVGIPADVIARVWDPFFTTKGEGKGTGLGLSTVRGIVGSHHGFITLESAPGKGSTFRIYLPAAEEPASVARKSSSSHPFLMRGNGELVLVVDDEPSVSNVLRVLLTKNGYRVLLAGNGIEAIEIFAPRSAEIDLVISDLNMPEMGGDQLARVLPRVKPTVKVLLMSGAGSGGITGEMDLAGAQVIKKPFTSDQLLKSVYEALAVPVSR
jgi:two-component system cell cycle sensor histidine kinase/response regulator CckA